MLFKEPGYDEFLAQKIRQGQQDIEQGRTVTLEQLKREMEELLERRGAELSKIEQELEIYG